MHPLFRSTFRRPSAPGLKAAVTGHDGSGRGRAQQTAIADGDGTVLAQVEKEEAVLVKTVQLDAGRKTHRALPSRGLWTSRAPWYALRYLEWVDRRAKASYAKNPRRVAAARAMTR